jgi:hypothetical protein
VFCWAQRPQTAEEKLAEGEAIVRGYSPEDVIPTGEAEFDRGVALIEEAIRENVKDRRRAGGAAMNGDSGINFTPSEVSAYYAARVPVMDQRGKKWRTVCPIHAGKKKSFGVNPQTGRWHCYSRCGRGGDMLDLEVELCGGDFPTRKAEVFRLVGRIEPECRSDGKRTSGHPSGTAATKPLKPTGTAGDGREVARYP